MWSGPTLEPRAFGRLNGRGLWTLVNRDLRRYWKSAWESLGGPAISALLFLAVFVLALGGHGETNSGLSFSQFVAPGIAMFALTHSAFMNGAVPLVYDKYQGTISDILSAPLSAFEITAGYLMSGTLNGLMTGLFVLGLMALFIDLPVFSLWLFVSFAVAGALLFAAMGVLVGLWSERWDHYAAAETFLVLPLGLLSGAFFPLDGLPDAARLLIMLNPAFHAVDGARYALTGTTAWAPWASLPILLVIDAALAALAWRLFSIGYRIKP
jgi:ABC-2 type transport system permease protein